VQISFSLVGLQPSLDSYIAHEVAVDSRSREHQGQEVSIEAGYGVLMLSESPLLVGGFSIRLPLPVSPARGARSECHRGGGNLGALCLLGLRVLGCGSTSIKKE